MARRVVAVDIGASGVCAVQMQLGRRAPVVRTIAYTPLPAGAVVNGTIERPDAVTAALRKLWRTHKFATKEVVLGVANENVIARLTDIDWVPPKTLRSALRYQQAVADTLAIPMLEKLNLDFYVLGEHTLPADTATTPDGEEAAASPTRRMLKGLLVAATSDMIDGVIAAVHAANLIPVHIDLTPFALLRAVPAAADIEPDRAEAVVDIGADVTSVVVHQRRIPRFVRIVPKIGGNTITTAIAAQLGMPLAHAEATKIRLGLTPTPPVAPVAPPTAGIAEGDPFTTMISSPTPPGVPGLPTGSEPPAFPQVDPAQPVINTAAGQIITTIRDSITFSLESNGLTGLARVVLTGGGSLLHGLADRLSAELRAPVQPAAPLETVTMKTTVPDQVHPEQLTIAIGLARGVR